jgi:hypothetical protein
MVEYRSIGRLGNIHFLGHATPRRFDRDEELN